MDDLLRITLQSASESLEQKATLRARLLGSVAATDPDDELSTLMSKAGDPLAAYNLFLAHSKKVKETVSERNDSYQAAVVRIQEPILRRKLGEFKVYHDALTRAYDDTAAVAALAETKLDHTDLSATALHIMQWIKAYRDAFPKRSAKNSKGAGQPRGRRPRSRQEPTARGRSASAEPRTPKAPRAPLKK